MNVFYKTLDWLFELQHIVFFVFELIENKHRREKLTIENPQTKDLEFLLLRTWTNVPHSEVSAVETVWFHFPTLQTVSEMSRSAQI